MASRGYNHVVLVGNLGRDPELRSLPSGNNVCTFSIATTERFKNKNGELQDRTDWHTIEIWGSLGDTAAKYLKKGKTVLVEGQIRNNDWEKDGVKHYGYRIVARNFTMLDSKSSDDVSSNSTNDSSYADDYYENASSKSSNIDDDDLPF
ncbi:MAG: single-stranded DNA-binding protein [Candidatus Kapaibacteriota bacterium]